jgi:hypothetical protein
LSLVKTEEHFRKVESEMRKECERYVKVVKLCCPRPIAQKGEPVLETILKNQERAGYCFVEVEQPQLAKYLAQKLRNRTYRGRRVTCHFVQTPEDVFV